MNPTLSAKSRILTTTALLFALAAPFSTPVQAQSPITVKDALGRTVIVSANPQRIVGIGSGALRMITYLQATDRVVGVEDNEINYPANRQSRPYRTANPQLAKLPRIGPGGSGAGSKKPDFEAVLAVKPQVIFMTPNSAALADDVQKTLGIPVVALSQGELAGSFDKVLYTSLRTAGKILQRDARAEAVINYIEGVQADVRKRTQNQPRKTAYVGGVSYAGAHGLVASATHYIPLDWIGAHNPVKNLPATTGSHIKLDKEALLKMNPGIIFLDMGGMDVVQEDMRKNPDFYLALQAFQKGRVYRLFPFVSYSANIDTALADTYAVGKVLYPQQFADVDLAKKADDIYRIMVGGTAYESMKRNFGDLGTPFVLPK